jgi:TetR/AcrR family transcriptional repressor of nem operon
MKALESYQCVKFGKVPPVISIATSRQKKPSNSLLEYVINRLLNDKSQKGCFMVNAEVEVALHDKQVSEMIQKNDQQIEEAFYMLSKKASKTAR